MQIIYKSLREIIPYKYNPRKNDAAVDKVAESIKEFGFKVPVVLSSTGEVITGHTRLKAAQKLNIDKIPCIIADDLTEDQIKAFRLADNKVSEFAKWDMDLLCHELSDIESIDMSDFGFNMDDFSFSEDESEEDTEIDDRDPSCQHNVFENQERAQFPGVGFFGIPEMKATDTIGDKMIRFMDWKECENPSEYIACFYYDDYKFINAWRNPDRYIDKLKEFKAVISPDFSLYTDFPRALQILSCYRRQWCGAYWQSLGLDVIPDVVWGDKDSYSYCFDGIPKGGTVAVSSVGVVSDAEWNSDNGDMFKSGYDEMLRRLQPKTVLFYGDMIDGLDGNIIQFPSYYAEKRAYLNEKAKVKKNGQRNK